MLCTRYEQQWGRMAEKRKIMQWAVEREKFTISN